jgi:hypothetical protein
MDCPDCLIREMKRAHTTFRVRPAFVARTLWNCKCGSIQTLPATFGDVEDEALSRVARTRAAFKRWKAARQNAAPARPGITIA